jgi:eukaryotic-like serine/threonine-protein kinase
MPSSSEVIFGDRYLLDDRIGAGGFGEVWRAHDLVLDRPVAIKLLRDDYGADTETLSRFRAEARHAGALSHENIARIYDYGDPSPPDPAYLVMEVVDGRSLAQELRSGRALDVARWGRLATWHPNGRPEARRARQPTCTRWA